MLYGIDPCYAGGSSLWDIVLELHSLAIIPMISAIAQQHLQYNLLILLLS